MILKSERICENGRVKVYFKCAVPDELSNAAEMFIENCRKFKYLQTPETIRAEFIYSDGKARIKVSAGRHILINEEFFVNFFLNL